MSTCSSCGAEISWVKTQNGRALPLNPEIVDGGNIEIRDDVAVYVIPGPRGVQRFVSHFATCPNAATHRKKVKQARGKDA